MKRTIVTVMLAALVAVSTYAQDKSATTVTGAKELLNNPTQTVTPDDTQAVAEQKAEPAPQVSAQDRQVVQALDVQRTGYAIAIAALQEKLDAVNAELARQVQRLQAAHPGYELAQGLMYVKKPEPTKAPEKKDEPKK